MSRLALHVLAWLTLASGQAFARAEAKSDPRSRDAAVQSLARFIFRSSIAHDLLSCDGAKDPVLLVSVDGTRISKIGGVAQITVAGPQRRILPIRPAVDISTQAPIYLEVSMTGLNTISGKLFGRSLCGAVGAIATRKSATGSWEPRWLEATPPAENWECRGDENCKSGRTCVLSWKEWDDKAHAWIGSVGVCLRGRRCGGDGDCDAGEKCGGDGARVISVITGQITSGICQRKQSRPEGR